MNTLLTLAAFASSFLMGAIVGWIALRRRADELEQRVSERTSVLEARNRELNAMRIELETANARLRQLTILDSLTGIANRRAFDQALAREVHVARRDGRPLALILCDIDGFKAFNDHYGHAEGDETLKRVARVVAKTFRRAGDLAARYGGEEFGVILPGVAMRDAMLYAERLRRNVWRQHIIHEHAPVGGFISLSAGVASLDTVAHATPEDLIKGADHALYRAKSEGRNRVAVARPRPPMEAKLERAS
ncbi:MAG: GGDEF domain-containing protein [Steroidobacterales bacterium]